MKVDKLTIAHISDLHRSQEHPVSNSALLNSLLQDFDTYSDNGMSELDLIIVSGDLVKGGKTKDDIIKQYDEAFDFLCELANKLLSGDRSKIILVPGNHDVSWEESQNSMTKIEEKEITGDDGNLRREILSQAIQIDSNIKWSWEDRSFYRVTDKANYDNRMMHFIDMYQKFYEKTKSYSLDPDKQFELFDFKKFGITVVGFNSCFHNDHLNRAGSINPECIAKVGLKLRALKKEGRLVLASWHHNTKGGPYDQDYMDGSFIKNLISSGIKIGFHGHQHRQEIIREENNIIDGDMMLILSAGSLCAGPTELPTGYDRQYNLLELTRVDDEEIQCKLFSRVKTPESSFENPVWHAGVIGSTNTEFSVIIKHPIPPKLGLGKAEALLGEKKYGDAKEILEGYSIENPLARMMLLECYEKLEEYNAIINAFNDPQTNAECVSLINAAMEVGNAKTANTILNLGIIKNSSDPSVSHLRDQLRAKI